MSLDATRGGPALALALAAQTAVMLPVFLLGSLSPLIMADMGLDAFGLGLAVALFYAASAAGSAVLAPLADRTDAWRLTRVSLLAVGAMAALIAAVGGHWWVMIASLCVAGAANGLVQPATNVVVARQVAHDRQGLAFGIKQSSIPLATMLGGFAVPVIGVNLGWQWAFAIAALIALVVMALCPRRGIRPVTEAGGRAARLPRTTLLWLALMSGLGAGSANAMAAFLSPSIVASGHSPATAGIVLAVGSAASILVRLASGYGADHNRLPLLPTVAIMFLAGALAYGILASSDALPMIVLGALLAFGMGWGWSALSILAIVRANLGAAGSATGITQAGVFSGAVLGPLGFGWLVSVTAYPVGWMVMAGVTLLAALCAAVSERQVTLHFAQRAPL
ncbi:MFS transporter [Pelagibacterium montanilacus]|uniref:MFS transporter n=1 Tax=Pelagibacterium montanilacus TaxID=2185280 RepID=UPI0013DF5457|nr:MFS transporter [Pelagibacterium montanilacus]